MAFSFIYSFLIEILCNIINNINTFLKLVENFNNVATIINVEGVN